MCIRIYTHIYTCNHMMCGLAGLLPRPSLISAWFPSISIAPTAIGFARPVLASAGSLRGVAKLAPLATQTVPNKMVPKWAPKLS